MAVSRYDGAVVPVDVVDSFNSGLQVFIRLMKKLCSRSLYVKELIDQLYEHFSEAEKKLNRSIGRLADSCAAEERDLSVGQREVEGLERSEKDLLVSLQRIKERLTSQEKRVEVARDEVRESERKVEKAEKALADAKEEQENCNKAAVVTAFIPVVNLVTVPALLILSFTVFEAAIKDARCSCDLAKSSLKKDKKELENVRKSKEEKEQEILTLQNRKSRLRRQINEGNKKVKTLRHELTTKRDLLSQLQQCMLTLSKVSGRSEVLKDQSSFIYSAKQLMMPMQCLVESLAEIPQCYLSTRAITVSQYWTKLKAIVDKNDDDDLDGYC